MDMEKERINELVSRFNAGHASEDDVRQIEALIESGEIELHELNDLGRLEERVHNMATPTPSSDLDARFYQMLALQKSAKRSFSWRRLFTWPQLAPHLAIASVTLLIGLFGGYLLRPVVNGADKEQMQVLSQQVSDLKEMMMLSMLERESATDRLKAVSLSQDIQEASSKVTAALIQTLNNDENINVRLAALDALRAYSRDSNVRQELIRSISRQESPLVQVALAELMVQLQAKSSVTELEKIVESDRTPEEVKKKIKQSIDILI